MERKTRFSFGVLIVSLVFSLFSVFVDTGFTATNDPAPGDPVILKNWVVNWPTCTEIWRILSADLEKIGVQVELVTGGMDQWVGEIIGGERNPYHTVIMAWGGTPDRLDPDFYLTEWFHSSRAVKGGRNYGYYINKEYDKIVDAQRREMDPKKRRELVIKAQEILNNDNAFFNIFHHPLISVYNKDRLEGVVPNIMGTGLSFPYIPWTYFKAKPKTDIRNIRVAVLGQDLQSTNPFYSPEASNEGWLRLTYDTLAKRDADLNMIPWAAESWKIIDDETVDVVLRDGMKFHDGQPVTIEDVKFTFDYIKKWKFPALANSWKQIESVQIMDGRRIRFKLVEPYAAFVTNVLGHAFIVPKHIWERIPESVGVAHPMDWPNPHPVGSGPFKLVEWKKGEYWKYEAYKEHRVAAPNIDGIYCILRPTVEGLMAMMEKGEAEILGWFIDGKQGKKLGAMKGLEMVVAPSHGMHEIRPNLRMKPMDDPAFRKAFQYTINRKLMLDVTLEGYGQLGHNTPINPLIKQWNDPAIPVIEYDLNKAREILRNAGYTWDQNGHLRYPKR